MRHHKIRSLKSAAHGVFERTIARGDIIFKNLLASVHELGFLSCTSLVFDIFPSDELAGAGSR
jgi:hypothetical protein